MAATPVIQVGIPNWNSPFVEKATLAVTYQWQRFLLALWQGSELAVGGAAQPINVGIVPMGFIYKAQLAGSMAVNGADKVEVSRDQGANWLIVGKLQTGGAPGDLAGLYPLRFSDQIRITWTIPPAPTVTWLPDS
jgi:hypothetical protein